MACLSNTHRNHVAHPAQRRTRRVTKMLAINGTSSQSRGGVVLTKASQPRAAKGRLRHYVHVGNVKFLIARGVKAMIV